MAFDVVAGCRHCGDNVPVGYGGGLDGLRAVAVALG